MPNYTHGQCAAIKKNGEQCKNNSMEESIFCGPHKDWKGKVFTPPNHAVAQAQATSWKKHVSPEVKAEVRNIAEQKLGVTHNEAQSSEQPQTPKEGPMTHQDYLNQITNEIHEDYDYIISGTGSRDLQRADKNLKAWVVIYLRSEIRKLKEVYGDRLAVMSGMAEGFDTALAVAAIKEEVDLICAVPSPSYGEYYWGKKSKTGQNRMEEFKEYTEQKAEYTVTVCEDHMYGKANFIRNQFMVDHADEFFVWDASSAGTRDCVKRLDKADTKYTNVSDVLPQFIEDNA